MKNKDNPEETNNIEIKDNSRADVCAFTLTIKDPKQRNESYKPKIPLLGKKGETRHVKLKCYNTVQPQIKMMIDSGCTMSIIKRGALKDENDINQKERVDLIGVSGRIRGLGSTNMLFKIGKKSVYNKFQVIDDDSQPANLDGIIGQDICMNSIIDLNKDVLIYHDPDEKHKLNHEPLHRAFLNSVESMKLLGANSDQNQKSIKEAHGRCSDVDKIIEEIINKKSIGEAKTQDPGNLYVGCNSPETSMPGRHACKHVGCNSSEESLPGGHTNGNNMSKGGESKKVSAPKVIKKCGTPFINNEAKKDNSNILKEQNEAVDKNSQKRLLELLEFIEEASKNNPAKACMTARATNVLERLQNKAAYSCERTKKILNAMETDHLTQKQLDKLRFLVFKYKKIFVFDGEFLPPCTAITHTLHMKDKGKTVFKRQYPLTKDQLDFAEQEAEKWYRLGLTEESVSRFNAPVIVVTKKSLKGEPVRRRLVMDLRILNEHLLDTYFDVKSVQNILKEIPRTETYTSVDLSSSYLQIPVAEEFRELLAFTVRNKRYQMKRCPFGLKSSGMVFAKAIATVLSEEPNMCQTQKVFHYVDDLLICGDEEDETFEMLDNLFAKFLKYSFSINPKKVDILRPSINFLGHKVSKEGITPLNDKIEAIARYPTPKTAKQIQAFIGMVNFFRAHVDNFAIHAEPLMQLIRKGKKFIWKEEQEEGFRKLKEALMKPPVLAHVTELYNPDNHVVLFLDASKKAISGCLAVLLKDKTMKPVEFFSKINNAAERSYAIWELELYALVYAVRKQFRYQLSGVKKFTVLTDNKTVAQIKSIKIENCEGRLQRWLISLSHFSNFEIRHIKGPKNSVADALSRMIPETPNETTTAFAVTRGMTAKIDEAKSSPAPVAQEKDTVKQLSPAETTKKPPKNKITKKSNPAPTSSMKDQTTTAGQKTKKPVGRPAKKPEPKNSKETEGKSTAKKQDPPTPARATDGQPGNDGNQQQQTPRQDELQINADHQISESTNENPGKIEEDEDGCEIDCYWDSDDENSEDGIEYVTDRKEQLKLIKDTHRSMLHGHAGIKKTIQTLRNNFRWTNMNEDIRSYIRSCKECQKHKPQKDYPIELKNSLVPETVWSQVYFDHMSFKEYDGFNYVLILMDATTRFVVLRACRTRKADELARILVEIFSLLGFPFKCVSDSAKEHTSKVITKINKLLKIKHEFIAPYHSQSNLVERAIGPCKAFLKTWLEQNKTEDWVTLIPLVMHAVNNQPGPHQLSPYQLMFGRRNRQVFSNNRLTGQPKTIQDYYDRLRKTIISMNKAAREQVTKARTLDKIAYDANARPKEFEIGDLVLRKNNARQNSLEELYTGPFEIVEILSPENVKIRIGNRIVTQHKNSIIKYKQTPEIFELSD